MTSYNEVEERKRGAVSRCCFLRVQGRRCSKRGSCKKLEGREDVCSLLVSEGMDASTEYHWTLDNSKAEKIFIVVT